MVPGASRSCSSRVGLPRSPGVAVATPPTRARCSPAASPPAWWLLIEDWCRPCAGRPSEEAMTAREFPTASWCVVAARRKRLASTSEPKIWMRRRAAPMPTHELGRAQGTHACPARPIAVSRAATARSILRGRQRSASSVFSRAVIRWPWHYPTRADGGRPEDHRDLHRQVVANEREVPGGTRARPNFCPVTNSLLDGDAPRRTSMLADWRRRSRSWSIPRWPATVARSP